LLLNMVFTWDDAHRLNPHKEKLFSLIGILSSKLQSGCYIIKAVTELASG
jgi:hypothetical protein